MIEKYEYTVGEHRMWSRIAFTPGSGEDVVDDCHNPALIFSVQGKIDKEK